MSGEREIERIKVSVNNVQLRLQTQPWAVHTNHLDLEWCQLQTQAVLFPAELQRLSSGNIKISQEIQTKTCTRRSI